MLKLTTCKPQTVETKAGKKIHIGYDTDLVIALSLKTQRVSLRIKGHGFIFTSHWGSEKIEDVCITEFYPYYLDLPIYYPITFGFSLFRRVRWFYFFSERHLFAHRVGNGIDTITPFLKKQQQRKKKTWLA